MGTIATFSDIQQHLEKCIAETTERIHIAVAWFTNRELLGLLTDKAAKGVAVEIIISDDVINQRLVIQDFIRAGGQMTICLSTGSRFLHEKFAVFDDRKVVLGSYNWTYAAERHNHESIIVSNDPNLIKQYQIRFRHLATIASSTPPAVWNSVTSGSAVTAEGELQQLELDLQREFQHTLAEAKRLHVFMNYDFIQRYLERYGAIGAAKRLVSTGPDNVQAGFRKLCEANRKDLTFENIMSQEKYQPLFNEDMRERAKKRLRS
ncbi:phospholipase D-like domain-containing protein [Hymenobacter cellulosivorans]|uniref:phospholipase D n=1 Tax=Hymenobacter cellulosivorans TaxID=2932249 RepID=A0ABY4F1Z2_9BACT|nr:phospholipase D-like domain-containing protein [Hymenobacter cellulosivorans]UOQ50691.1 phospholipase D-like domain-containing protein [Hymenobacter cellulosivorans]